jgi:hypothetical protein
MPIARSGGISGSGGANWNCVAMGMEAGELFSLVEEEDVISDRLFATEIISRRVSLVDVNDDMVKLRFRLVETRETWKVLSTVAHRMTFDNPHGPGSDSRLKLRLA